MAVILSSLSYYPLSAAALKR